MSGATDYRVTVPEGRSGPWKVERFEVDGNSWKAMRYALGGRPIDSGVYTRLHHDKAWEPMMSDTPAEVRDHLWCIHEIKQRGGKVLLNGLGLGMVLKAALGCENVTHVDVVEIDADIISLVWPHYASDSRAVLHHADALTMKWPVGSRWNVIWHDIWANICSDNLEDMKRLHRNYGRRCDWQGSWSRDWIEAHS